MAQQESIICQQRDNVLIIEFNRAEKKNALSRAMYQSLTQALLEAEQQDSIHAVVLSGSETCFTAGNDLSDFIDAKSMHDLEPVLNLLMLLPRFKKPLIAAVNGLAIGIGTTLLLHCDMVIADHSSQFQLPFINLAACPEAASSFLLPRLVGHVKASELLMLGERFDAQTALQLKIINEIAPIHSALTIALEKANKIASKSPKAIQLTKALLKKPILEEVSSVTAYEAKSFFECLQSKEAQLALQAFFKQ
ncbi:enoyl-CoA hydratase/isomerase family protein [Candidatus Berkiella cookevillensis]|uniref:2,3-dehydroadipyl-CoA hydratase n=1 Tax=Candidatus Berkiella cookevillensis TaxID=437022 RepID=A0A0Q9YAG9_9GAMM|nr:enoyl-CoA hydratase-related protein [Candidatus Berkiella cookevillensis]MCS5708038.1 enoyl-CoA hydratase/isomerase family protein [Candidatus Berkiella cookevillensis]